MGFGSLDGTICFVASCSYLFFCFGLFGVLRVLVCRFLLFHAFGFVSLCLVLLGELVGLSNSRINRYVRKRPRPHPPPHLPTTTTATAYRYRHPTKIEQ